MNILKTAAVFADHIVLPPVNTYVGHYELKITDGEAYGSVYRNCYPKDGRLIV